MPLIETKESEVKPSVNHGTKDGPIDGWILLMRRYISKLSTSMTPIDKAWRVIELLEGEARDFTINKSEQERSDPETVFNLLARRFGTGNSTMQVRQHFAKRDQKQEEDCMQYLDALESLRNKGFIKEDYATRCYEILQCFMAVSYTHLTLPTILLV